MLLFAMAVAPGAWAGALAPPEGAVLAAERIERLGRLALPTGVFDGATVPLRRMEGRVERRAWRLPDGEAGTLELLAPLRARLVADGWRIVLDCDARACGGFDFRYAVEILPEPDMHVDLGDYRFVSAERPGAAGDEALTLLVSRDSGAGFVQIVELTPATVEPAPAAPDSPAGAPPPAMPAREGDSGPSVPADGTGLAEALDREGRAVLSGVEFESGSAALAPGAASGLAALAAWLAADPGRRLALVGHTDASGGLAANVALSQARAEAVRRRLIEDHGADPARLAAQGVGYLAPRATNATEAGRGANRRVEAVVTSAAP